MGNRTRRTKSTPGKRGTLTQKVSDYTYDAIYELTRSTVNGSISEDYTYDEVGNRLTDQQMGVYTYNTSNEMLARPPYSWSYDLNGNTTSPVEPTGTTSYTWVAKGLKSCRLAAATRQRRDFENRLTRAVDSDK